MHEVSHLVSLCPFQIDHLEAAVPEIHSRQDSKLKSVSMNHRCQHFTLEQGLSQDLETGCLKLAIIKVLGVQMFKVDHNILRFPP